VTPQLQPVSGRTVAHYQILEKLGEGGMGVVYKARDTRLGRLVAIKFLAPRLADSPRARARFLREARIVSALNHPHIAVIHEAGECEGNLFLVFEYLPGGNLITRAPHTLAQALEYAVQLAEALAAAHRHGIVHRDVKPANALFTEDDTLKLADFGLARQTTDVRLTGTGTAVGTPAYMAPEQFQGANANTRSDVYSLGVVVHELLAGTLPQPGHALAVPAPLQPVLERALAAEPRHRYADAGEMAADLRTAVALLDSATRAETVALTVRAPHRAVWAFVLVLALAAALASHTPPARQSVSLPEQLVVLPFLNNGGASWQVFCDGLTETLSAAFSRLEKPQSGIHVVPAAAVRKQSVSSVSDARRMLGARYAVTGSMQPELAGLHLTIRVLDAKTARPLGAREASFAPGQLPLLPDWAVSQIARVLSITSRAEDSTALEETRPHEPGAYEFYLEGRGYLSHYDVPEDLANAVASFHKALQRDPRYALAYAGMAEAQWRTWRATRDPQWLEQAAASAERARRLNDRLAPTYIIIGRIENSRGRNQEALRAFRRALELEPLNPDAYGAMALAWQSMGNPAEAEAAYRKVLELRPGEWLGYNNLAVFYSEQHRFTDAEKTFQQMIALTPENVTAFQNLGGLYLMMGRYAEADAALERALALKPTPVAYSNLGTAYYYAGRYAEAAAMMEKAVEQRPADFQLWGNLADACSWAPGKRERAREAWASAIKLAKGQLSVNPGDAQIRSSLGVYQAHEGNCPAALTSIARARHGLPSSARVLFKSARVDELCGRRGEAFEALAAALQSGEAPENVRREPEFAALRRDSACLQLLPKEICK